MKIDEIINVLIWLLPSNLIYLCLQINLIWIVTDKLDIDFDNYEFLQNIQMKRKQLQPVARLLASGGGSQTFEICSMIINKNNPSQFITIAHDGFIKIWNIDTDQCVKSHRIKCGYLTSLINFQEGYAIGTGSGQILCFNHDLEAQWSKKVHIDCVNDLLETEQHLISIGSDGKVCLLKKKALQIEKEIDLTVPLARIIKVKDWIYVSGNPSFRVNLLNFQIQQEVRSLQMIHLKDRIFCCSDEKGLQILGKEQNDWHIACHFMLSFNNSIITVAQEMIGVIRISEFEQDEESYCLYKVPSLNKGFAIKAGFTCGEFIYLAGEEGIIYKFYFQK